MLDGVKSLRLIRFFSAQERRPRHPQRRHRNGFLPVKNRMSLSSPRDRALTISIDPHDSHNTTATNPL